MNWYSFFVVFVAIFGLLTLFQRLVGENSPVTQAVNREGAILAKRIAESSYYVQSVYGRFKGMTLNLHVADAGRKKQVLFFSSSHPDFRRLNQLQRLDVVEFEFTEQALPGVKKVFECAYIRLKER